MINGAAIHQTYNTNFVCITFISLKKYHVCNSKGSLYFGPYSGQIFMSLG